jgi:GTP-binding protein HflX
LTRLYNRRFPRGNVYTVEQARELALISHDIGRQVGLIIDRKGNVVMVIVGTSTGILIPHLDKARQSSGRLSGLRLLHTHLNQSPISEEDLMDMVFLRLDSVSLLTLTSEGEPDKFQWAHILPPNEENKLYQVYEPVHWCRVSIDLAAQTRNPHLQSLEIFTGFDSLLKKSNHLPIRMHVQPVQAMFRIFFSQQFNKTA